MPSVHAGDDLKLIDFGLSKFWEPSKKMEMRVPRGTATGSLILFVEDALVLFVV